MKTTLLTLVSALALGLTACERDSDTPRASAGATTAPASGTSTTPANVGPPQSQAERREGANPVQGQVDPKHNEQHKDFQQKGDRAGPSGPDTQPRPGG